jgi:NAD(P)-dependent dehydrogenase (short-subunit alcohol dehydrogenase family)
MIEQGTGGSIVLIASISGHTTNFPQPQVSYNVSKAGVIMTAKSLAAEWGRYRIRVNTISPGYMDTVLNEGKGLDGYKAQWYSRTPLGRMGGKDELNGAVILLCSEAGSFITGTDVKVDGKFGPFSLHHSLRLPPLGAVPQVLRNGHRRNHYILDYQVWLVNILWLASSKLLANWRLF